MNKKNREEKIQIKEELSYQPPTSSLTIKTKTSFPVKGMLREFNKIIYSEITFTRFIDYASFQILNLKDFMLIPSLLINTGIMNLKSLNVQIITQFLSETL
jgi:hypothetical protein